MQEFVCFVLFAGMTTGVMVIGYPVRPASMLLVGDLYQYIRVYLDRSYQLQPQAGYFKDVIVVLAEIAF